MPSGTLVHTPFLLRVFTVQTLSGPAGHLPKRGRLWIALLALSQVRAARDPPIYEKRTAPEGSPKIQVAQYNASKLLVCGHFHLTIKKFAQSTSNKLPSSYTSCQDNCKYNASNVEN